MIFSQCSSVIFKDFDVLPCALYRRSHREDYVLFGDVGQKTSLFTESSDIVPEDFYIDTLDFERLQQGFVRSSQHLLQSCNIQQDSAVAERLLDVCHSYFTESSHSFSSTRAFQQHREQFTDNLVRLFKSPELVTSLQRSFLHDEPTYKHSVIVCFMSYCFAKDLSYLYKIDFNTLSYGALLHDVGKVRLDAELINKPSTLTAAEKRRIHTHPAVGALLLRVAGITDPEILRVVEDHHEKDDGTGYPNKKKADEISVETRICRICDVFEALTVNRPYRQQLSFNEALSLVTNEICADLPNDFNIKFQSFVVSQILNPPSKKHSCFR